MGKIGDTMRRLTAPTYGYDQREQMSEDLFKAMERLWSTSTPYVGPVQRKPLNPLEQYDDVDLMMELISRGYAVHLPLENADKLK